MNKQRVRQFLAVVGVVAGLIAAFMVYQAPNVTTGNWYQTQEQQCLDGLHPTADDPVPLANPSSPGMICTQNMLNVQHNDWQTLWVSASIAVGAGLLWWLTGTGEEAKRHA
jgi:hypothetical protein